jgi:L-alanine-DL-glutamate epimerase-like enolase superfamily enzyme
LPSQSTLEEAVDIDEQSVARAAPDRTSSLPLRSAAQEQCDLASELAEEARRLSERARELLANHRAERAAISGIGVAMLDVAGRTSALKR